MLRDNSRRVSLEGFGIAPPRVGKGDIDLTHHSTRLAFHAWDRKTTLVHRLPMGRDRKRRSTRPRGVTPGTTGGAAIGFGLLLDGENHLSLS